MVQSILKGVAAPLLIAVLATAGGIVLMFAFGSSIAVIRESSGAPIAVPWLVLTLIPAAFAAVSVRGHAYWFEQQSDRRRLLGVAAFRVAVLVILQLLSARAAYLLAPSDVPRWVVDPQLTTIIGSVVLAAALAATAAGIPAAAVSVVILLAAGAASFSPGSLSGFALGDSAAVWVPAASAVAVGVALLAAQRLLGSRT